MDDCPRMHFPKHEDQSRSYTRTTYWSINAIRSITNSEKNRKTKNYGVRLMTIIFSNGIAERMCVLGNTATRADLDSKRINASSILWQEIHREFLGNTTSYNRDPWCTETVWHVERCQPKVRESSGEIYSIGQTSTSCTSASAWTWNLTWPNPTVWQRNHLPNRLNLRYDRALQCLSRKLKLV